MPYKAPRRHKPTPGYKKTRSPIAEAIDAAKRAEAPTYPTTPKPRKSAPVEALRHCFYPPAPIKSINATSGKHWATYNQEKVLWQDYSGAAIRDIENLLEPYRGHRIELTIALPVKDNRRRDGHNYVQTVKWIVDGITRTQLLIPDDNQTWLELRDTVFYKGEKVWIKIQAADEPWKPE